MLQHVVLLKLKAGVGEDDKTALLDGLRAMQSSGAVQGIVAMGTLGPSGVLRAEEVLAKHDENYMPPELLDMAGAPQP